MHVVCNSPILYVVEYPGLDAFEVIDKRFGRGGFIRAEAAQRFRRELGELNAEDDESDAIDALIDQYDALLTQPAIYQ